MDTKEGVTPMTDRRTDPSLLANAPAWVAEVLHRVDESADRVDAALRAFDASEKERADQEHRGKTKITAALLKTEANVEITRQEVLGTRADFARLERRIGEMETRFETRVTELQERVAALEARRDDGPLPETKA